MAYTIKVNFTLCNEDEPLLLVKRVLKDDNPQPITNAFEYIDVAIDSFLALCVEEALQTEQIECETLELSRL